MFCICYSCLVVYEDWQYFLDLGLNVYLFQSCTPCRVAVIFICYDVRLRTIFVHILVLLGKGGLLAVPSALVLCGERGYRFQLGEGTGWSTLCIALKFVSFLDYLSIIYFG